MATVADFLDFISKHILNKLSAEVLYQLGELVEQYDQDYILFILKSPTRIRQFIRDHEPDVMKLDGDLSPAAIQSCAQQVYSVAMKYGGVSWVHPTVEAFIDFVSEKEQTEENGVSSSQRQQQQQLLSCFVNALRQCDADKVVPMIMSQHAESLATTAGNDDRELFVNPAQFTELVKFLSKRVCFFETWFVEKAMKEAKKESTVVCSSPACFLLDFYRGATAIRDNDFIDDFHNLEARIPSPGRSKWYGHHDRLKHADDVWAMLFPLQVCIEHFDTFPVISSSEVQLLLADVSFGVRFERSLETMLDYYFLEATSVGDCSMRNTSKVEERLGLHSERIRFLRVLMALQLIGQSDVQCKILGCVLQLKALSHSTDEKCRADVQLWIASVSDEKKRGPFSARCSSN